MIGGIERIEIIKYITLNHGEMSADPSQVWKKEKENNRGTNAGVLTKQETHLQKDTSHDLAERRALYTG